ncbi:MAG TPA: putative glycolipid-binding domain-containing protein [Longimicrobiaceae bacterium]
MKSMLWRRLDHPGHESAWVLPAGEGWQLTGTAVFEHEGQPCCLEYTVECGPDWVTRSARVRGSAAGAVVDLKIEADPERRWRVDGAERPEVEGCLDIDLNFSPSTNLLPIRRLDLAVGEQASVRAAWLRFPSFSLEPLQQRYHRLDGGLYRYESGGGRFTADLLVDESGFVTRYPGVWEAEGNG